MSPKISDRVRHSPRFDPVFLIPLIVILGAGLLFAFWWRDFAVSPPPLPA